MDRMTLDDWAKIYYMHYSKEDWGTILRISRQLVFSIEHLRIRSKKPVILRSKAYVQKGHSKASQHYLGNAADIEVKGFSLLEMYILAEQFNFTGLGLYPTANRGPFIHVDVRPHNSLCKQARWVGLPGKKGYWKYIPLNEKNLLKYCTGK